MTIEFRIWRLAFDISIRLFSRRQTRRLVVTLRGHTWDSRPKPELKPEKPEETEDEVAQEQSEPTSDEGGTP